MLKLTENPVEARAIYYTFITVSIVVAILYTWFMWTGGGELANYFMFLAVMLVLIFLAGMMINISYAHAYAGYAGFLLILALAKKGLLWRGDVFVMITLFVLVVIMVTRIVHREERLIYNLDKDIDEFELRLRQSEENYTSEGKRAMMNDLKMDQYERMVRMAGRINSLANMQSLDRLISFIQQEMAAIISKAEIIVSVVMYPYAEQEGKRSSKSFGIRDDGKNSIKEDGPIERWICANKRPLIVTDFNNDLRFTEKEIAAYPSTIAVPLTSTSIKNDRTSVDLIGYIRIDSPEPQAFKVDVLRDLSNIGDLCSAAIVNSYLYFFTERQATTDLLTGLYVHRYFRERLDDEIDRADKKKLSLSFMMCDIDHFKGCNDRFGHLVGDKVLKMVSNEIVDATRNVDFVARYGGEEFAVILPETKKRGLRVVAERIRAKIAERRVKVVDEEIGVTISIGCSVFPQDGRNSEEIIAAADAALYRAKAEGRNRIQEYEGKKHRG